MLGRRMTAENSGSAICSDLNRDVEVPGTAQKLNAASTAGGIRSAPLIPHCGADDPLCSGETRRRREGVGMARRRSGYERPMAETKKPRREPRLLVDL
jgi:hypothetical protein